MYVANPGRYAVTPLMTKAADYDTVTLSVDGTALPGTFDGYNTRRRHSTAGKPTPPSSGHPYRRDG